MGRFRSPVAAMAVVSALSALSLFAIRNSLIDSRTSLAEARVARDHSWDQYLLAERRSIASSLLIGQRDPFSVESAVTRLRGMFIALSAATDQDIPQGVHDLLGTGRLPIRTPLAQDLLAGRREAYDALDVLATPLREAAIEIVNSFPGKANRLEKRIRLFTNLESAAFVMTVFSALALNVLSVRMEPRQSAPGASAIKVPDKLSSNPDYS